MTFQYAIETETMTLSIHIPGNDVYYPSASFTNTYSAVVLEIPVSKTVKLSGSTAPGRTAFTFDAVPSSKSYTSTLWSVGDNAITVNGADTAEGRISITTTEDDIRNLDLADVNGIWVTETDDGQPNWSYDATRWFVKQNWEFNETTEEYEWTGVWECYIRAAGGEDDVVSIPETETPKTKVSFTNTYTSSGTEFSVNKMDGVGNPLAGAVFALTNSQGRKAYTAVSDSMETVRFTDVSSGTYTLTEESAPTDYVKSDNSYEIKVSGSSVTMDGKRYDTLTVKNYKQA